VADSDLLMASFERLCVLYDEEGLEDSTLERIVVKPQWTVLMGQSSHCGMALNYSGIHEEVYGKQSPVLSELKGLIGRSLMAIARDCLSVESLQKRCLGLAALVALSQPLLTTERLRSRGFHVPEEDLGPKHYVRQEDIVAVVGYGGIVKGFVGRCAEVHASDMRPRSNFRLTIIDQDVTSGPEGVVVHGPEDNEAMLGKASFALLTGSSLVNGTCAELLAYSRNTRLCGLYGPSASLIPDVLFERGCDFLCSRRVSDPERFAFDAVNDIDMEKALSKKQANLIVFKTAGE
jgi:uncharacterized protein (DUF4213/DUF364 family)